MTKSLNAPVDDSTQHQLVDLHQKDQVVLLLPRLNLVYYATHGLFEANLIEWSKQFCSKDKDLIDIGAHTGTYALCLSNVCRHVHAFEPQKMTYYALCGGVALSHKENISCYQMGLGSPDQVGLGQLKIVNLDGGGSTLQSVNEPVLKTEEVMIQTLDHYEFSQIGLIKIDVENNEYYVLLGSQKTLQRSGYPKILFESNQHDERIHQLLNSLGYHVVNINGYENMWLASHEV